ncbi:GAF domain-containing sensor histidine kinase [Actinopolymorpha pittospori]
MSPIEAFDPNDRHRQWLLAALEMSRVLLSGIDRDEALRFVTGKLREISGADYVAIVSIDPVYGEDVVNVEAVDGLGLEHFAGTPVPRQGAYGAVMDTGTSIVSSNITLEESFGPPPAFVEALSVLGLGMYIPLSANGTMLGALVAGWRRGSRYETAAAREAELVEIFAGAAAVSLQQQQSQLLLTQDRDRIAAELRDDVIDQLFAIGTDLHTISGMVARPEVRQRAHEAIDKLDDTTQKVRDAIFALRQEPPADQQIASCQVLDEIDAARTTLGFTPRLVVHGRLDRPLPSQVQRAFVQAIRGALTNAASHTSPTSVEVALEMTDDQLGLTVTDNGQLARRAKPGALLTELHESARRLDGSCTVRTNGGNETVVDWHVPLNA